MLSEKLSSHRNDFLYVNQYLKQLHTSLES
jgi:hypothetical protein